MNNAVIYARYSSDKQREESIEGQIRECTAFAESQDITILDTYIDRALSAKTDHRPSFLQMVADSAKKQFQYIIVYTLDRFSRNRYDSAIYKNKLKKNGVKVLSAKENIVDGPIGIITESLLEGMAEYYSAELAQKVIRDMKGNAMKGNWNGGSLPLGYNATKDKHLAINPPQAKAVKMIYELYDQGFGIMAIISKLNEKGLSTRSNKPFNRSSIDGVLRNTKYIGYYMWQDIKVPCPRIISDKLFLSVQEKLKSKHRRKGVVVTSYPLTGKLFCGKCGSSMKSDAGTSRDGSKHLYYVCNNRRRNHKCDLSPLPKNTLEKIVLNKTLEILDNQKIIDEIIKQILEQQKNHKANPIILSLENDIKTLKSKIDKLYKAMESTDAPPISLLQRIKGYEQQLPSLEKEIAREKLLDCPFVITEDHIRFFFDTLKKGKKNTDKYTEKIFSTFIRKIVVTDDTITIDYNYSPTATISNQCSANVQLVGPLGIEPRTNRL